MSLRVVVEADGGSRGNPGPAGCGAAVFDAASGDLLAERAVPLGTTTNNVAEYQGLLHGLAAAAELGATSVEVRMDSKLVIEQMSGRWRVKHENLQPLAARARELAAGFDGVTYEWVPRARNAHADRLANEAMDGADEHPVEAEPARGTRSRPQEWLAVSGAPTRLVLLRHGQTAMSVDRRYSGRGDVPLTELGMRQARAAGRRVAALDGITGDDGRAVVLTSPLRRARQSAQAVVDVLGGEAVPHEGLVETDFGEWEGLTFQEAADRDPELHRRWLGDAEVLPPAGESLEAVYRRVVGVRDDVLAEHAGRTVVLVSHVTPIKALLRLGLAAGPSVFYRMHLDLSSLSIVEFYGDGNASVRLVNDISHLRSG
ncbi:bifunctional RNase H/acid phosphatase [Saccharopolyspora sp. CA-218241]|uniref:bifunctional RNase H/acid phosphatase n=1 Tax=Saccharopolyspora sp. CA-218241 TaxID=3240027 RepID=UPI003D964A3A